MVDTVVNRDRKVFVGDGLNIFVDTAVEHMNNASGISCEIRVVGYHNNCVAFGMDAAKFFHDNMRTAGVEISGRFVGEDDFRSSDKGTSNSDTLFLAARKLGREEIFALAEMKTLESVGSLDKAMSFACARINEREGDIFDDGQIRDEIEILENEADILCAETRFSARSETVDFFAV